MVRLISDYLVRVVVSNRYIDLGKVNIVNNFLNIGD